MNLKDNLKKIRKANNLSQEDLAEKLNVSRQAVSKWEQGLAYPEMDKVIQLCNMFNLNMDEILNQDIEQVERESKSKININKYIDDFLGYIKKTVKMFCSMKFKDQVKCVFEQFFIIIGLIIFSALLGSLLSLVVRNVFSFLPSNIYYPFYNVLEGVYYLVYSILAVIVIFYVFKIRYLDYYEFVEEEPKEESTEVKEEKIELDDKREKIIIRDPKHSEYKFINGILSVLVFIIKCFLACFSLGVCASLVGVVMVIVISFLFVKTGLLFVGAFMGCLGLIAIHLIMLYLIYCFITNVKIKKGVTFFAFIISLIMGGVACGLIVNSIKDYKIVDDIESNYLVKTTEEMDMNKNLIIEDNYIDIEFVESNNKNLKIEYTHASYCNIESFLNDGHLYFNRDCGNDFVFKNIINDLENKVIVKPDLYKVIIYTNKDNIKLLKNNLNNYYKSIRDEEVSRLRKENDELSTELNELKNECYMCLEDK